MRIGNFGATFFGVSLALSSYSAMGTDWPPTLDSDPEVQPPKWDWQLAVPVKVNPDSSIKIYDIDMFENEDSGAVEMLHGQGIRVICYVDVGSWENWRDDKDDFPPSIRGARYYGFPDERWLDIRDVNPQKSQTGTALATILEARFDRALSMGCDAVEPDNMDGYDTTAHESTGFPLTYEDQIYFNLWVADAVHARGMLVGLKNDINQAHDPRIYDAFDFVVSEQCFQYNECDYFSDFLDANKPVFEAEYGLAPSKFCPEAKATRISAIKKRPALNAKREDCSAYYTAPPVGNRAPTAAFDSACTGLTCDFTDGSSDRDGTVTGWNWDFGDKNGSTDQKPNQHTYAAAGTYRVSLTVTDDGGAMDTVSQDVTVNAGTSRPVEITYVSMPAEDGWVRESGENSNIGGRRATGGAGPRAIRMGDDKRDRQYKSILSFDTESIPAGVTILSARLELTRGADTGTNPFITHGTCSIDVKSGAFGGNAALQDSDFQAEADAEGVAAIENQGGSGTTYNVDLAAALRYVNKAGRTQLRLYCSTDDNDDQSSDLAGFYSADNRNAARRPRLIVGYQKGDQAPTANTPPDGLFDTSCTDLTCNFTDGSSDSDGSVKAWSWDFGDGGNGSTAQNPSHTYNAAGTYRVSLTVTDDDGAADTVAQDITAGALTWTTYHPQAINVTAGSYDWGTLASFKDQDDDTYDIASAQSANGGATDWEASATISGAVQNVGRISVRYEGQYSIHSVSQELYLYNYETGDWELFDTRLVGQGNDLIVLAEITTNPQRYVSSSGETRARIRGFHATTQDFYVWANYLAWEVEGAGN